MTECDDVDFDDVDFDEVAALYPWLMSRVEQANHDTCYRLLLWQDRALTPQINTHNDEDAICVWFEHGDLYVNRCLKAQASWEDEVRAPPLDYLSMIAHITHYVQEFGWMEAESV